MHTQSKPLTRIVNLALAALLGVGVALPAEASAPKTQVDGALDKEAIRQVVRANIGDVRDCYNAELSENETLEGRVAVSFVVQADGSVSDVGITESTMPERFDACLSTAVASWSFPAIDSGSTKVVYPFVMSPG